MTTRFTSDGSLECLWEWCSKCMQGVERVVLDPPNIFYQDRPAKLEPCGHIALLVSQVNNARQC